MIEKIREGLYIKKSFDGYRVVHPIKNDDGTINWKNLITGGSWWKVFYTFLVMLGLVLLTLSYSHDLRECSRIANFVAENPCAWCYKITDVQKNNSYKLNISGINLSEVIYNGG